MVNPRFSPACRRAALLASATWLIFAASLSAADKAPESAAKASTTKAPEQTPTSLPGADTHVFRDLKPEPLRLHVFKPKGWAKTDRRPALIWFFGGGWTRGTPTNAAGWAQWAAARGMVGIAPDYRTKDRHGTSPLASVADARSALRWVQEHAAELGIDPSRVVVGGNSAGGHVALWTGIKASPPESSDKEAPLALPIALVLTSPVSDTSKLSGYTPARFGENAEALSPVHQLEKKMPPVLLFHGDADKTVPHAQSIALNAKLTASGNACSLVIVPGGSHNFGGDLPEWREKTRTLTEEFLQKQGVLPVKLQ